MSRDNAISLGDLARVKKALRPGNADTWNSILKLLALPLEMQDSAEKGPGGQVGEKPVDDVRPVQQSSDAEPDELQSRPPATKPKPLFTPGDEFEIEQLGTAVVPPAWNKPQDVFSDLREDASDPLDPSPPLFAPGQSRALIAATAIALAETGELDEERAIAEIARGEPIRKIPLRLRPTSRFGVQVLVDRGPRMQPLRQDQQRLIADLLDVIGAHRATVLRFADFPDFAGPGTRRTWKPYEPPAAGTVVLVISDLGLGWLGTLKRRHHLQDWIEWGRMVRSTGARPVALVPHGSDYWPESLQHNIRLVHWDHTTTVGAVRGARVL